jgi:hypothetical protein
MVIESEDVWGLAEIRKVTVVPACRESAAIRSGKLKSVVVDALEIKVVVAGVRVDISISTPLMAADQVATTDPVDVSISLSSLILASGLTFALLVVILV